MPECISEFFHLRDSIFPGIFASILQVIQVGVQTVEFGFHLRNVLILFFHKPLSLTFGGLGRGITLQLYMNIDGRTMKKVTLSPKDYDTVIASNRSSTVTAHCNFSKAR